MRNKGGERNPILSAAVPRGGDGKNGVLARSPPYFCECGVLSFVLQQGSQHSKSPFKKQRTRDICTANTLTTHHQRQNLKWVSDDNPVLRDQLKALDCSQASFCTVPVSDELIIEQAEKLRGMQDVMHTGFACASGGAALDRFDGLHYMLAKSNSAHKQFDTQVDALLEGGAGKTAFSPVRAHILRVWSA